MTLGADEEIGTYLQSKEFFDYGDQKVDPYPSVLEYGYVPSVPSPTTSDYLVSLSTNTQNYCVGVVDMVNSTNISARLNSQKLSRYYEIFLNSMSRILGRFGGQVIKNIGDCLMYYFPESSKASNKYGFSDCLETSLVMTESRDIICKQLKTEGLPDMDFRVSADYGAVVIMKSNVTNSLDMIGPPVNMCTKINRYAKKNEFVIGGDLHEMAKKLSYDFRSTKGYSLGFKWDYPVFSVKRKSP